MFTSMYEPHKLSNMTIDIPRYLQRIGYDAPCEPTLPTLHEITLRHAQTFAFETIDSWTGQIVDTDLRAVEDKLVRQRRGGYCFETNRLLQAVLRQLGFDVDGLSARVRWGQDPENLRISPRTHMLLRAKNVPDAHGVRQDYLVDVGFGGSTPTAPIPWEIDAPTDTPHGRYRLMHTQDPHPDEDQNAVGTWVLEVQRGDAWRQIYTFDTQPSHPADYAMANWYVCTFPTSHFRHDLTVVRPVEDARIILRNLRFRKRRQGETLHEQDVHTPDEALQILRDAFDIILQDETAFRARFEELLEREKSASD